MDFNNPLSALLELISRDKLPEIKAERLLNAAARLSSGAPTGTNQNPKQTHTHL